MAVLAVPRIEVRNWVQQDWGSVKWGAFLNVMFWCVRRPARQPNPMFGGQFHAVIVSCPGP
jgi:hypothetical protein